MIDVIIPTYDRAHFIERAINSVLAQSYQDFTLYVINDGSTDDTESVLKKYSHEGKIRILCQENKGVSAARNLGIKNSQSRWITFLDSDDEWLTDKLEKQLGFLKDNPDCQFVHSNEIWFRNGVRVNAKKKFDKSNHDIFRRSLETCLISPSTVMMTRELCLKYGSFDESFVICEDYDLWIKILAHEEIGFIPHDLIKKYGGHDDQLSTRYLAMDYWRLKALINLLKSSVLTYDKEVMIREQIEIKSVLLRNGYFKHQNHQGLKDLDELIRSYK